MRTNLLMLLACLNLIISKNAASQSANLDPYNWLSATDYAIEFYSGYNLPNGGSNFGFRLVAYEEAFAFDASAILVYEPNFTHLDLDLGIRYDFKLRNILTLYPRAGVIYYTNAFDEISGPNFGLFITAGISKHIGPVKVFTELSINQKMNSYGLLRFGMAYHFLNPYGDKYRDFEYPEDYHKTRNEKRPPPKKRKTKPEK